MKSKGHEFWLFGIDTVVELSQKGIISFLEHSKQVSHKILRKLKQQQQVRQENKKDIKESIRKGKEQDIILDFEEFNQDQKKLKSHLNYEKRLCQLPNEYKSKENEINHEPEQ